MKEQIRNIIILFGSTLSVMAGAVVTPVLPDITTHFKEVENIEFLTKLILSIPPLFIALFSPVVGYLFEKLGRRPVLIASALLYGISGSSGFYLNDIYLILAGRAVFGIAISGLMTGFIVVIGDLFANTKMNKFIGIQGSVMSLGGVAYLLMGGALGDYNWNYPFLVYLVSFLIAIGLLLFLSETRIASDRQKLPKIKFTNPIIIINFTAGLVMVLYLMVPTQLPYLMTSNFEGFSASSIGKYLSIWILFSSSASLLYSKLRKHYNFSKLYAMGFLIWSIGQLLIYYSSTEMVVVISLILMGIGNGIVIPNLKAHLLAQSPSQERGRHSGFLTMSLYIGQFFSPIIMQPLIVLFDISLVFVIFGFLSLCLSIIFLLKNQISNKLNILQ